MASTPTTTNKQSRGIKDDTKKRLKAQAITFRVFAEGKSYLQAFREVVPQSKANDSSASKEAHTLVKWLRTNYPMEISSVLDVIGGSVTDIARRLVAKLDAKFVTKDGIVTAADDHRVQLQTAKLLLECHGVIGRGGGRAPAAGDGQQRGDQAGNVTMVRELNIIMSGKKFGSLDDWESAAQGWIRQKEEQQRLEQQRQFEQGAGATGEIQRAGAAAAQAEDDA